MRILICGLPGSGKTTLASKIHDTFDIQWFNADKVRKQYNDWDFSKEGREKQANRMKELSLSHKNTVCDFVCPTNQTRKEFDADIVIWMNTIEEGRFEDTNKIFERPEKVDFEVIDWNQSQAVLDFIEYKLLLD